MNGRTLLEAMSYVDEGFVEEAERPTIPKTPWLKWALAAACVGLVLLCWNRLPMPGASAENLSGSLAMGREGLEAVEEGETPNVTVKVMSLMPDGFTATVTESAQIPVGTEVTVILEGEYEPGDTVILGAYTYDEETRTITAESGEIEKG